MTIRVRLTLLVALTTAVLSALSLWLGPTLLRDVVADGVLEPIQQQVEGLIFDEFAFEDEFATNDLEAIDDELIEETVAQVTLELRGYFEPVPDFPFTIPEASTGQMVDRFGTDGVMYISPAGFYDDWGLDELVWPVTASGQVQQPIFVDDLDVDPIQIPLFVLFDLLDSSFNESAFDISFDDDGEVLEFEPLDSRLVFDEVEIEGVTYGLVADASDELAAVDSVRTVLWWAAAVLTMLAAVATWIISGRALAPVGAMTRKVDLISSTDLQERLPGADRGDEIGGLATTLNRMLNRLEQSDQQRRRFVSDASHELRTPLAVLTNQADVALAAPDSTSLEDLAQVVQGETGRLSSIVEDLLVLARHDEVAGNDRSGVMAHTTVFDFDDVVLDEVRRARRLPVDGTAVSAGRIEGDPLAAARVVGHLLDNAARHGHSKVAVGLTTVEEQVVLTVDDDGEGIAEGDRADVFERFTRLDDSRSRDGGGAGLGLSVVKATVGAMGGTVAVDRSPLGGARFMVTLPAA